MPRLEIVGHFTFAEPVDCSYPPQRADERVLPEMVELMTFDEIGALLGPSPKERYRLALAASRLGRAMAVLSKRPRSLWERLLEETT